ncbi:hypothetical protein DE146DRAFT_635355 [Phaeosphaeria sp. MPI-PUGE-AT-0046c]|nr:hypothetical protein DE146DRAFT_635355 [Phaeosphaeria sp. MPI-PUGE-AT-0046c]
MPSPDPSRQDANDATKTSRAKWKYRAELGAKFNASSNTGEYSLATAFTNTTTLASTTKTTTPGTKLKLKLKTTSNPVSTPSSSLELVFIPAPTHGQDGRALPSVGLMRANLWRNVMRARHLPHLRTVPQVQTQRAKKRQKNLEVRFDLKKKDRKRIRGYLASGPDFCNGDEDSRRMNGVGNQGSRKVEGEEERGNVPDAETWVHGSGSSETLSATSHERCGGSEEVHGIGGAQTLIQMAKGAGASEKEKWKNGDEDVAEILVGLAKGKARL